MTTIEAAPTRIEQVTVYRNGALVKRRGRGRGRVEVRGLPLLYSSDTLRVHPAQGTVRELEETVQLQTTPAPLPVSEDERVALTLQVAQLDDEIRACNAIAQAASRLMPELPDPKAPAALPDPARFAELLALADEQRADALERKAAAEHRKRALERAKKKLAARHDSDREPPRLLRGARFVLDVGESVDFELEYFIHAARWVPTYALHLDGGQARLVVAALVAQATGEDWAGVSLAVSTADLLRESTLPTLGSWRIGRAQPPVARGYRPLPSDLPTLFWGYDKQPRKVTKAPPPPPPPKPEPRAFEKASTDEVRSFEEERTDLTARMALKDDSGVDLEEPALPEADDLDGAGMDEQTAEAPVLARSVDTTRAGILPPPAMRSALRQARERAEMQPANMPAPSMAVAIGAVAGSAEFGRMAPGAPPMAKRRARAADDEGGGVVRVESELPPRWRTAYLRMAGPDEGARGQLLPLDPTERLAWLLEAHDVEGAGKDELRRAIDGLLVAQQRLQHAPLPRGTSALLGTHYPALMNATAPTEVPGDGAFYRVEVREDAGPARFEHRAVPRSSNDVWRVCKVELKGPPLPAGPLAVFEDGAFRVNAHLDGSGGAKPLDVNLGVDPDVRVVSRTAQVHQAEKGLVSQTSRVEHKIHVEIRSTRSKPAQVHVWDRLPVPEDNLKDVTVQLLEERPPSRRTHKDAFGNEVLGALEWTLTLMPGDTALIDWKYAIDLPAKSELEGGNRRE